MIKADSQCGLNARAAEAAAAAWRSTQTEACTAHFEQQVVHAARVQDDEGGEVKQAHRQVAEDTKQLRIIRENKFYWLRVCC